jgi:enamine deaminase RidA (YjgF/YER057c/UK114 family)
VPIATGPADPACLHTPRGIVKAAQLPSSPIENIRKILDELGGVLLDIVSLTMYYVRDVDFPAIQRVRARRFEKATGPAATGVRVAALVDPALLVELTVTAVIPNDRLRPPHM